VFFTGGSARNHHLESDPRCLGAERNDSLIYIDSSIVKGSPRGGWVKKGELAESVGRSRTGRASKIHAAVTQHGRPLRLENQRGRSTRAEAMAAARFTQVRAPLQDRP
jgi:hypothetical protein